MLCYEAAAEIERLRAGLREQMDNYSDLFSQHEPDPLLRELNGNVVWYWKPMNPSDKRVGCLSNAPFEAAERIKKLETALREIAKHDTDADGNWGFFRDEADEALKEKTK
jgi:hypothetical protein